MTNEPAVATTQPALSTKVTFEAKEWFAANKERFPEWTPEGDSEDEKPEDLPKGPLPITVDLLVPASRPDVSGKIRFEGRE